MCLNRVAFIFFTSILFGPFIMAAEALPSQLSQNPEWLKIVHYEKSLFGGYKSDGRTSAFFLHENGYKNPALELEILYRELTNLPQGAGPHNQHARCRFPARSKWLAKKLNLKIPDDDWCADFSTWKNRIRAQSVTLVFSSYYLNSPSSTYGHTLLRLNRRGLEDARVDSEGQQLLDFGFNYGANPTSDNPILYAISGMTGLMPGSFLALPYFYKVREYNDYEVRDIWEYDLTLTPQEVDFLVDHFWEVAHTQFGYLYVTKNCGYQIFKLLDIAAPQLKLMDQLRTWIVPGDTIRIADRAGIVHRVKFRPSVRRQFLTREAALTKQEKKILWDFNVDTSRLEILNTLPENSRAKVVDAQMDLMDLQHSREMLNENAPIKKIKNSLLLYRSKLPITEPLVVAVPHEEEPHSAHPSGRIGLGGSVRALENENINSGGFDYINLSYRAALHDLVDPIKGYLKNSRTEMGHLNLRYDINDANLSVQSATILALDSFGPITNINDSMSWRLAAGMKRQTDMFCNDCLRTEFQFGMGYAYSPTDTINLYSLMMGKTAYSPSYRGNELSAHLGPLLGLNMHLSEDFNTLVEWGWAYNWHDRESRGMSDLQLTARYFIKKQWAFDIEYKTNPYEQNAAATIFYYY